MQIPEHISLYVHIPWCEKKCLYCDFNSHEIRESIPEENYLDALLRDLSESRKYLIDRKIMTVFFGGGTPSTMSSKFYGKFLTQLRNNYDVDRSAEITLEANPGTSDEEKLGGYFDAGINRISIGVQTLNDRLLAVIGRVHSADQAYSSLETARSLFANMNVDLMFALPGQTLEMLGNDLRAVAAIRPDHLSIYHLTVEPNTWFAKHPPQLPSDDLAFEMQEHISDFAQQHGYLGYEVSAFCSPSKQSKHNLNYWEFGDYLGVGAGAHSKISDSEGVIRFAKYKQPKQYMDHVMTHSGIQAQHRVNVESLPFEFFMNALRLLDGVPTTLFEDRTGLSIRAISSKIDHLVSVGLLDMSENRIRTTRKGMSFLNDVLQQFL